ncbi:hypothetical protein [Streptomyces agglomeratus]|uniref:hypothetical protein n=1 Tax=Streptomyces agglomeratus TaxID=285458 RepID=UPI00114CFA11|nr:hypothetical protein [Streptomyces agglomeratus]
MARQRLLRGRPQANRLAEFLCGITEPRKLTVRTLAGLFPDGPSASTWATYLNGTQVIPKPLLGRLLTISVTDRAQRAGYAADAMRLWNAADKESRRPETDTESTQLVRLHQQLTDALTGQARAEQVASKANAALAELRHMGAYLESVINRQSVELRAAHDRERGELEYQLTQAQARLERTQSELKRAQRRRYTAEQAQQALAREALEAREQIARLQDKVAHLGAGPEPAALAVPVREIRLEDFDHRLDLISDDAALEDEELADLVDQAHLDLDDIPEDSRPRIVTGTLIQQRTPPPGTPQPRAPAEPDTGRAGLSETIPHNAVTSTTTPATAPRPHDSHHVTGAQGPPAPPQTGPASSARTELLARVAAGLHQLHTCPDRPSDGQRTPNTGTPPARTRASSVSFRAPRTTRPRSLSRPARPSSHAQLYPGLALWATLRTLVLGELPVVFVFVASYVVDGRDRNGFSVAGWIVMVAGGAFAFALSYRVLLGRMMFGEPVSSFKAAAIPLFLLGLFGVIRYWRSGMP